MNVRNEHKSSCDRRDTDDNGGDAGRVVCYKATWWYPAVKHEMRRRVPQSPPPLFAQMEDLLSLGGLGGRGGGAGRRPGSVAFRSATHDADRRGGGDPAGRRLPGIGVDRRASGALVGDAPAAPGGRAP